MTPTSNIHVVVTLADGSNDYDHAKVHLDDMDDGIDYNNNNVKGIRMFREIINKLKVYQKHQKHERRSLDTQNRKNYSCNTSPAAERYSSSSSSSSSGSSDNSKSSSTSSSQNRLDSITGYFKFININTNSSPSPCKQKKLLRSPTSYMYIQGMSGLHSRVPRY